MSWVGFTGVLCNISDIGSTAEVVGFMGFRSNCSSIDSPRHKSSKPSAALSSPIVFPSCLGFRVQGLG